MAIPRRRPQPPIPPGGSPAKPQVTYESLLGKPATLNDAGLTGPTAPPSTGPLDLRASGTPPLKLERTEGAAAVLPVVQIKRNGTVHGFIGLDASDQLALIAADGTTVLVSLTNTGELDTILRLKSVHLEATTDTKTPKVLDGSGNQVVGGRGTAVTDASHVSAIGGTQGTTAVHASASPVPKADYDATVDILNGLITASNSNKTAIDTLNTQVNAAIDQLNLLLARVRAATGHGLIA